MLKVFLLMEQNLVSLQLNAAAAALGYFHSDIKNVEDLNKIWDFHCGPDIKMSPTQASNKPTH